MFSALRPAPWRNVRIWAGPLLMLKEFHFFAVLAVLACSPCSSVLVCARSGDGPGGTRHATKETQGETREVDIRDVNNAK
jgi:hypothetical protein